MTLLVALKGTDGIVLAADTRGTFGDPRGVTAQNDAIIKAHVLAKHAAILMSGSSELGALILKQASDTVSQGSMDGATAVMNVVRDAAVQSYAAWFPSLSAVFGHQQMTAQAPGRPDLNFIVAGYDPALDGAYGRPVMYSLLSGLDFPPMLHDYGFAVNGVPQYALYLLNRLYEPGRSTQELIALAVYAITETASQDGKVGGPVRVVTVRPEEGCTVLPDEDIATITAHNEQRAASLRDSFYERATNG
jgi:20S proteasome alpha/beta subunit